MSKRPRQDHDHSLEPSTSENNHENTTHGCHEHDTLANLQTPSSPAKFTRLSEEPQNASDTGTNTAGSTNTSTNNNAIVLTCNLPNCPTSTRQFTSSEEYEIHYAQAHMNRCLECLRNFPSLRLLECHIKENHDMLSRVRREKGEKIYECFVENCEKICATAQKRRLHLIDKHYYPKDFNFYIVNCGVDKVSSLLRSPPTRNTKTRIRSPSDASTSNGSSGFLSKSLPRVPATTAREQDVVMGGNDDVKADDENIERKHKGKGKNDIKVTQEKKSHFHHPRDSSSSMMNAFRDNGGVAEEAVGERSKKTNKSGKKGEMNENRNDVEQEQEVRDEIMSDLTSRMSAVQMVPPSVRFGRRGGGGGLQKR